MSEQQESSNTEEQKLVYYRLLLAEAGRFYEKHRIGRVKPFNIFSVLRSESDEVNLHSRFLHALLNHKEQKSKKRENLKYFLKHIGIKEFALEEATVKREQDYIDILIRIDNDTAVAVENKIYAEDQYLQLQRYKETLVRLGYKNIYMVYLTLDGGHPSSDSRGKLAKDEIITISYQTSKNSIQPWLKDCQDRAFDNLELQIAIKQYLRIVRTLTENSLKETYMSDLLNLLRKDNNVQLSFDLQTTLTKERPKLMIKLWKEIAKELNKEIPELHKTGNNTEDKHAFHPATQQNIEKYCKNKIKEFGLQFPIEKNAWFSVAVEDELFFGITCDKNEFKKEYDEYYSALRKIGKSSDWWPVYRYEMNEMNFRDQDPKVFAMLLDDTERQNYVSNTVNQVKTLWNQINRLCSIHFTK